MSDRFRYMYRVCPTSEFLSASFATVDTAKEYATRFTKTKGGELYLFDTHDSPHRLVGVADRGFWRQPVATCKACKGKGRDKDDNCCNTCSSLGVILEKAPWRP